jgi:predicted esterase
VLGSALIDKEQVLGFDSVSAERIQEPGMHVWAEYTPVEGETYKNTCNVHRLDKWLEISGSRHYEEIDKMSGDIIFAGTSNGCIPAYTFAQYYRHTKNIPLVILHNGCPAIDAVRRNMHNHLDILMVLGRSDPHWDYHEQLYKIAFQLKASILSFAGGHSHFPTFESMWNKANLFQVLTPLTDSSSDDTPKTRHKTLRGLLKHVKVRSRSDDEKTGKPKRVSGLMRRLRKETQSKTIRKEGT